MEHTHAPGVMAGSLHATPGLDARKSCQVNVDHRFDLKSASVPWGVFGRWLFLGMLAVLQVLAIDLGQSTAAGQGPDSVRAAIELRVGSLIERPAHSLRSREGVLARARGLQIQLLADAHAADEEGEVEEAELSYASVFIYAQDSDLRRAARTGLVSIAARQWPAGFRSRFLESLGPAVLGAARAHHVPPSVTLAQAILESGWGRSQLTRDYHNLFGVKAGASSQAVPMASREHRRGRLRRTRESFRVYESRTESIWDHAALLGSDRRYARARSEWTDWRAFLEAIAPKYASSPTYVDAVSEIVELYALDRWDALVVEAVEADSRARAIDAVADAVETEDVSGEDTGLPLLEDG